MSTTKNLLIVTILGLFITFFINWGRLHAGFYSIDLGILVGASLIVLVAGNLLAFKYIRGRIYSTAMIIWSWAFLIAHYFITDISLEDDHGIGTAVIFTLAALVNIAYILVVYIVGAMLTRPNTRTR